MERGAEAVGDYLRWGFLNTPENNGGSAVLWVLGWWWESKKENRDMESVRGVN